MSQVMVYLNEDAKGKKRKLITATLLQTNASTIRVRLPDGNVVLRDKVRDVPAPEKG